MLDTQPPTPPMLCTCLPFALQAFCEHEQVACALESNADELTVIARRTGRPAKPLFATRGVSSGAAFAAAAKVDAAAAAAKAVRRQSTPKRPGTVEERTTATLQQNSDSSRSAVANSSVPRSRAPTAADARCMPAPSQQSSSSSCRVGTCAAPGSNLPKLHGAPCQPCQHVPAPTEAMGPPSKNTGEKRSLAAGDARTEVPQEVPLQMRQSAESALRAGDALQAGAAIRMPRSGTVEVARGPQQHHTNFDLVQLLEPARCQPRVTSTPSSATRQGNVPTEKVALQRVAERPTRCPGRRGRLCSAANT